MAKSSNRWKGPVLRPRSTTSDEEEERAKSEAKRAKARLKYNDNIDLNRERARTRINKKRLRNQQWMVNYMVGKVCCECGISDSRLLAMDHLGGEPKFANVADLVSRGAALHKLVTEVAKCRVLCHNCHMLHTIEQVGGSYHSKLTPCSEEEFRQKYTNVS